MASGKDHLAEGDYYWCGSRSVGDELRIEYGTKVTVIGFGLLPGTAMIQMRLAGGQKHVKCLSKDLYRNRPQLYIYLNDQLEEKIKECADLHNQLEKKTKECEDSHKMYEEEFDKKMHGEGSNSNDDDNGNENDSDQEEEQKKKKKKRKVTPKVIAQQELPPDAKEAFGDGKNKFGKYNKGKDGKGKEGKGNDFKVGTVNMAHDHGMRYKLKKMVTKRSGEKDWDLGGSWFLHKTKGVWEFMSVEVSDKLKKAQIESGEWKVLSC